MEERTSPALAAPALAVIGGILAVAGSLLAWAEAAVGPASFSAKGIDGWEGKATLLGGVILLVAGIAAFVGVPDARDRLRGSAVVGGLLAAGVGIYTAVTARDQILDAAVTEIATQFGVPEPEARSTLELAMDRGEFTLSLKTGIWLVIVGGAIGVLAGIVAMLRRERKPAMPVSAGTAGLTGWAAPGAGGHSARVPPGAPTHAPGPSLVPDQPPASEGTSSVWGPPAPRESDTPDERIPPAPGP
ncbi:MAG: hypothetical protein ACXWX6_02935 [Actinomycetota bacterium]